MPKVAAPINRRILVIDDNAAIHNDFRKVLGADGEDASALAAAELAILGEAPLQAVNRGFEVDSAYQGQEGVAKIRQAVDEGRPYAMAFVDMRMPPGWDGLETIERLCGPSTRKCRSSSAPPTRTATGPTSCPG